MKAGDPLLYVASPDITNAISTYRKAKNRLDLAQRKLDRSKDLLEHKAISQRDFESAQADYNDAATDVQTALQALQDLRRARRRTSPTPSSRTSAIRPELAMRAPIAGTVVQKTGPARPVHPGRHHGGVRDQQRVDGLGAGPRLREGPAARSTSATQRRRCATRRFPTPSTAWCRTSATCSIRRPGRRRCGSSRRTPTACSRRTCSSTSTIHDKATRDVLVVPTAAVLYDEQNFPFVYVQVEPGKFAQRLVKLGGQQDDETEIVDGLKAGDRVVSQGSVFLQFANTYQG